MELTERLELSTSPLPRECSTTELRQPEKPNLTILSRTEPSKHYPEGKKREQHQTKIPIPAWLHRTPGACRQQPQHDQRNNHPATARGAQIHTAPALRFLTPRSDCNRNYVQPTGPTKWCTGEDSNLRNSKSGRFTVCCH